MPRKSVSQRADRRLRTTSLQSHHFEDFGSLHCHALLSWSTTDVTLFEVKRQLLEAAQTRASGDTQAELAAFGLSLRRQCALLGVARSGVYRVHKPANDNDAALTRRIDELFTAWPFLGSRRMTAMVRAEGVSVNRERVHRLMRLMGIAALWPKPENEQVRARPQDLSLSPARRDDRAAKPGG
jgi:hypothetical protein